MLQYVAVRLELLQDALESATQSVVDARTSLKVRCMFVYMYVCLELTHCPKERGTFYGWMRGRRFRRVPLTHVQYVAVCCRALSVLQCATQCCSRRVAFIENRRNMLY